jgi:hypothetical protein
MKSPISSVPLSAAGIAKGRPIEPQISRSVCSAVSASPKVNKRPSTGSLL